MSEASRRAAEEVVTKLWVLSLHEQRVELVDAAIARAVEGERLRLAIALKTLLVDLAPPTAAYPGQPEALRAPAKETP